MEKSKTCWLRMEPIMPLTQGLKPTVDTRYTVELQLRASDGRVLQAITQKDLIDPCMAQIIYDQAKTGMRNGVDAACVYGRKQP